MQGLKRNWTQGALKERKMIMGQPLERQRKVKFVLLDGEK
jgi:hypothetical protein